MPWIRGVLLRLVPLDHCLVGRHARISRVAVERRCDRVRPERPVAECVDHRRVEAQRCRHDLLRVGDAQLRECFRLVRAVGRRAVGSDEVRGQCTGCRQRAGQVGLALRVADLLGLDAGRLQTGRDHLSGLRDAGSVRIDDCCGLRLEDVLCVVAERQEDVRAVTEEDDAGLRRPVHRGDGDARDDRLRCADGRVERLGSRGDCAFRDHADPLVVDKLLTAGRAFLLIGLDETCDERDGMTADAAELLVDVLHRQLRPGSRQATDHDLAALLIHPADQDLRLLRVGLPPLPLDVREVVLHRRRSLADGRRGAPVRPGCRCRGSYREHQGNERNANGRGDSSKALHGSPSHVTPTSLSTTRPRDRVLLVRSIARSCASESTI